MIWWGEKKQLRHKIKPLKINTATKEKVCALIIQLFREFQHKRFFDYIKTRNAFQQKISPCSCGLPSACQLSIGPICMFIWNRIFLKNKCHHLHTRVNVFTKRIYARPSVIFCDKPEYVFCSLQGVYKWNNTNYGDEIL